MIGKWQANNGTRYNFFYNNYFQLYSPNNPMIDCRWVLNNGCFAGIGRGNNETSSY